MGESRVQSFGTCCCCTGTNLSELSLGFYNCFHLSIGKEAYSVSLQTELTTVFLKEMHPFILIRDGRLAIDHGTFMEIFSNQLNLRLQFVLFVPKFNYLKCINENSLGRRGEPTVEGGCAASAVVLSGSGVLRCWSVQHVTPWLQLISRWAVNGGRRARGFIAAWERGRWRAAAWIKSCDKENHFINCGPMWHDRTITPLPFSHCVQPWIKQGSWEICLLYINNKKTGLLGGVLWYILLK